MTAAYWSVASWLVRDILRTVRFRILGLTALVVVVILAKILTFGGFLLFLNRHYSPDPIVVPGLGAVIPDPDPVIWGPAILVAGIVMGALGYLEAHWRMKLASDYAMNAMRRALAIFCAPDFEARSPRAMPHQLKVQLLATDSSAMMRAAMPILSSMLPLVQLLVCTAILMLMSWQLAVAILLMGVLYLVPFYFINRRVVRAVQRRQMVAPGFKSAVAQALGNIAFPQFRQMAGGRAHDILFGNTDLHEYFHSFRVIRTTRDLVTFLSSVFLALFMLLVIIYVSRLGIGGTPIALVVYAVVLFHAFAAANMLAKYVATFNRFLPQFRRFVNVLALPDEAPAPSRATHSPVLRPGVEAADILRGSLQTLTLQPGQVCVVVQPLPLSFRTREDWLSTIRLGKTRRVLPFLVPDAASMPDITLRQIVQDTAAATPAPGVARLLELPFMVEFVSSLPAGLDTSWRQAGARMPEHVAFAFAVAPALNFGSNLILVDGKTWTGVPAEHRDALRAVATGAIWLVGVDGPRSGNDLPEDGVWAVLASENGILGMGDLSWAAQAIRANPDSFRKRRRQTQEDTLADDELDEDEA